MTSECDVCHLPASHQFDVREFPVPASMESLCRRVWGACPTCKKLWETRHLEQLAERGVRATDQLVAPLTPQQSEYFLPQLLEVVSLVDANRVGPFEPLIFCTKCGFHSQLSDFDVIEEQWTCPGCGMDESGLENLPDA